MRDPRVGRGFYNTYHTNYALLRYPIDHVFVSEEFLLAEIGREEDIGSDHFPMSATFHLHPFKRDDHSLQDVDPETLEQKEELIEEGLEKAKEDGDSKEIPM